MEPIEQFGVYFGYVKFSENQEFGKERPVVIVEIAEDEGKIIILPIYSFRKWFFSEQNADIYLEINDLKSAGLKKRSFINLHRVQELDLIGFQYVKKLGKLSDDDIDRVISALFD